MRADSPVTLGVAWLVSIVLWMGFGITFQQEISAAQEIRRDWKNILGRIETIHADLQTLSTVEQKVQAIERLLAVDMTQNDQLHKTVQFLADRLARYASALLAERQATSDVRRRK